MFIYYECNENETCKNWGGLGVRVHPRSSKTSPFDRAHMTFYSTLMETMCLSCTVFEYSDLFVESGQFLPTPPAFVAYVGTGPDLRGYRAALFA